MLVYVQGKGLVWDLRRFISMLRILWHVFCSLFIKYMDEV